MSLFLENMSWRKRKDLYHFLDDLADYLIDVLEREKKPFMHWPSESCDFKGPEVYFYPPNSQIRIGDKIGNVWIVTGIIATLNDRCSTQITTHTLGAYTWLITTLNDFDKWKEFKWEITCSECGYVRVTHCPLKYKIHSAHRYHAKGDPIWPTKARPNPETEPVEHWVTDL